MASILALFPGAAAQGDLPDTSEVEGAAGDLLEGDAPANATDVESALAEATGTGGENEEDAAQEPASSDASGQDDEGRDSPAAGLALMFLTAAGAAVLTRLQHP